jgi:hypothetical protein
MGVMDRSSQFLTAAEITLIADRIGDLLLKKMMEQITTLLNERAPALEDRSVKAFCARWGISRGMFYAIPDEMPATMLVGGRRLISPQAESAWVAEREGATRANINKPANLKRHQIQQMRTTE